ncbi:unnamed protein product [Rhizophagus irregularis]|nr:unnamed protein product [Rhizophagus irregularis]
MEIQRIRSALGFGTGVTSEEWKKPSFVQYQKGFPNSEERKKPRFVWWAFEFRRITKNQDSSWVSQVGFRKTEYPKIHKFLSVLGHWIYRFGFRFRLSVLRLWICG